ncbi:peptidoglycan hydrolase CwlO-like protein [Pullulanibacillus pueri]|uniref:Peptidase P60 n=1 Tax=Pullulanibacillus pueri TaxID=1437324 RepID=A0A8J3EMI8_9BACL|nr:C40 family peptidase [Pullulanibacillus pueri]MBM7683089.1 peptidoglycan hydrolase CwlO-like protein [Pullulanibacillus pueri]GGH84841.1 peptidase P60 [Pullulanibacillus pueri]
MGKKLNVKVAGLCVGCLMVITPLTASAESKSDLNNQKQSIAEQKQKVQGDLDQVNQKIQKLTGQISKKQIAIGQTQDEVEAVRKDISKTKARIADRENLLKKRLNSVYKQGDSSLSYLEVLFGSKDFGDFINRATALYKLNKGDQEMIEKQKEDQELLKKEEAKVNDKLKKSQEDLNDLQKLVGTIEDLQSQKEAALASLNSKEDSINSKLDKLAKEEAEKKAEAQKQAETTAKTAVATSSSSQKNKTLSASNTSSSSSDIKQFAYTSSMTSGSVSDLINSGKRFIGNTTYVFGAMDPAGHKFDCSGFVNWAFQQIGINLGARSTSGLQYVGSQVSASSMKPGDLVFFDTYKHNGHVAIYIGGGQFIGSQSSTGVAIASMGNSYWNAHFHGYVRRILQ